VLHRRFCTRQEFSENQYATNGPVMPPEISTKSPHEECGLKLIDQSQALEVGLSPAGLDLDDASESATWEGV